MDVLELKRRGGAEKVVNKARVREWVERMGVDLKNPVEPEAFCFEVEEEEGEDEEMEE